MNRLQIARTTPFSLLICAVLALSPLTYFSLTPGASFHDNQRILQCAVLVLGAAIFIARLARHGTDVATPSNGLMLALALFFALGAVSGLLAYSPRHAFYEWSTFWLLLVVAGVVTAEIDRREPVVRAHPGARDGGAAMRIDMILLGCGSACVIYILHALVLYVMALVGRIQPDVQALTPGFDNFRFLNHVQTVSLPLLGLLTLRVRSAAYRGMWWRMTALWWMLLFVSGGRGTVVGVMAAVLFAGVVLRKRAWPWCRVMVLTALAGLVAYLVFYVAVPWCLGLRPFGFLQEVAQRSMADPASGRLDLWKLALRMIADDPLLGAGPLHFAHLAKDAHSNAHPHNWVLQIGAEWGLPALTCLLTAVGLGFRLLWRAGNTLACDDAGNQLMLVGLFGTGAAIVIDGLVSGLIVMPTSQLWIALYLGCTWAWLRSLAPAGPRRCSGWHARIFMMATLLATGLLLYAVFPEVLDIPAHEADYRPPKRAFFAPRLWRNGYF